MKIVISFDLVNDEEIVNIDRLHDDLYGSIVETLIAEKNNILLGIQDRGKMLDLVACYDSAIDSIEVRGWT